MTHITINPTRQGRPSSTPDLQSDAPLRRVVDELADLQPSQGPSSRNALQQNSVLPETVALQPPGPGAPPAGDRRAPASARRRAGPPAPRAAVPRRPEWIGRAEQHVPLDRLADVSEELNRLLAVYPGRSIMRRVVALLGIGPQLIAGLDPAEVTSESRRVDYANQLTVAILALPNEWRELVFLALARVKPRPLTRKEMYFFAQALLHSGIDPAAPDAVVAARLVQTHQHLPKLRLNLRLWHGGANSAKAQKAARELQRLCQTLSEDEARLAAYPALEADLEVEAAAIRQHFYKLEATTQRSLEALDALSAKVSTRDAMDRRVFDELSLSSNRDRPEDFAAAKKQMVANLRGFRRQATAVVLAPELGEASDRWKWAVAVDDRHHAVTVHIGRVGMFLEASTADLLKGPPDAPRIDLTSDAARRGAYGSLMDFWEEAAHKCEIGAADCRAVLRAAHFEIFKTASVASQSVDEAYVDAPTVAALVEASFAPQVRLEAAPSPHSAARTELIAQATDLCRRVYAMHARDAETTWLVEAVRAQAARAAAMLALQNELTELIRAVDQLDAAQAAQPPKKPSHKGKATGRRKN